MTEDRAISLNAVIKAVDKHTNDDGTLDDDITCILEDVPSVTPQPKTGRWEWVQYDGNPNIGNWHCSECNRIVCGAITAANPVYAYKYCPNCGARMVEPQESEEV